MKIRETLASCVQIEIRYNIDIAQLEEDLVCARFPIVDLEDDQHLSRDWSAVEQDQRALIKLLRPSARSHVLGSAPIIFEAVRHILQFVVHVILCTQLKHLELY